MNPKSIPMDSGLYLVATPIGNARDITLRALDILTSAEVLVAEDTRTLRKLLDIHAIPLGGRRILAYHDHSSPADRAKVMALAAAGSVAYASEAGTPLIADPGFKLVQDAHTMGICVTAAPGPSAVVTALSLAGLATDRFLFAGFLPPQAAARTAALTDLLATKTTLVLYEAPNRTADLCAAIAHIAGPDHPVTLCRELTKRFEEIDRTTADALATRCRLKAPKGEVVLVVAPMMGKTAEDSDIDSALRNALLTMRVKDASEIVAGAFNLPKRQVYQRALQVAQDNADSNTDPNSNTSDS